MFLIRSSTCRNFSSLLRSCARQLDCRLCMLILGNFFFFFFSRISVFLAFRIPESNNCAAVALHLVATIVRLSNLSSVLGCSIFYVGRLLNYRQQFPWKQEFSRREFSPNFFIFYIDPLDVQFPNFNFL